MTAIHRATGPSAVTFATPADAATASGASLLPSPGVRDGASMGDATVLLYQLVSSMGTENLSADVKLQNAHKIWRDDQVKREMDALKRSAQASEGRGFWDSLGKIVGDVAKDAVTLHVADVVSDFKDNVSDAVSSPNFWKDLEAGAMTIAKWAALVGSVALSAAAIAASGGTAAAFIVGGAAIALSTGGFVVSETKCFGDGASQYVGLGMELAGGVVSGAMAGSMKGASVLAKSIAGVSAGAAGAGAAAGMVSAGAKIEVAHFAYVKDMANSDAEEALGKIAQQDRAIRQLLDLLRDAQESNRRALDTITQANQTYGQTQLIALGTRG